jgi:hypothetical protein
MACLISIPLLTLAVVRVGFGAPTGPAAAAASERPGTAATATAETGSQNGAAPRPGSLRSFVTDAGPVFRRHCVRCHNEDDNAGGLRLDTYEGALRGGDRGPAVIPRNPAASLILQKVMHRDRPYMPPKKFLPVVDIDILRGWIEDGARR